MIPGMSDAADHASRPSNTPTPNTMGTIPSESQCLGGEKRKKKEEEKKTRNQPAAPPFDGRLQEAAKAIFYENSRRCRRDYDCNPLQRLRGNERKIVTVPERRRGLRH